MMATSAILIFLEIGTQAIKLWTIVLRHWLKNL